jgi:hypothetical protein
MSDTPTQLELFSMATDLTAELTNCQIDLQLARDYAAKHELSEFKKSIVLKHVRKIKDTCREMQEYMKANDDELRVTPDLTRPISNFVFDVNKHCNGRIIAALKRYGIATLNDLVKLSRVDLAIIPHMNPEALRAINLFMVENSIPWNNNPRFAHNELAIPRELSRTASNVDAYIGNLDYRLRQAIDFSDSPQGIAREISNVKNRWNLAVNKFTVAALANKTTPADKSLVFKSKVQARLSRLRSLGTETQPVI